MILNVLLDGRRGQSKHAGTKTVGSESCREGSEGGVG